MRGFLVSAFLVLLTLAAPAWADQMRFTGYTRVDATVIRDALQNIMRVASVTERCDTMTAVEAHVLPPDYRPGPDYDVEPGARYERWDVTLCGRVVAFLMGFWNPPEGGTMIQIGYPYPGEPRPTPR